MIFIGDIFYYQKRAQKRAKKEAKKEVKKEGQKRAQKSAKKEPKKWPKNDTKTDFIKLLWTKKHEFIEKSDIFCTFSKTGPLFTPPFT